MITKHTRTHECTQLSSDHGKRVHIIARRDIRRGEELNYDYGLVIDEKMTKTLKSQYQCRCGSANCRGTMLAIKKKARARKAASTR